ncbi:MAG: right-handed parallel beta-helix repeat-containing protein [Candidatus Coatesbacteria bacterium]|nr:right-handed parallel beta-helix repeat-containing protein [Candidatus Coatesbacteria bacterium]
MHQTKSCPAIIAISLLLLSVSAATAAPQISIFTDREVYQAGDTIEVSLSGTNEGPDISVDVYIGLLTPGGDLFTLGGLEWSQGIVPWIVGIQVPSGFSLAQTPFFWFDLPCEMPPINVPGEFSFLAGVTRVGTLDFVSEIVDATFEVIESPPLEVFVDGINGSNSNDGSEDAPWQTITYALNSVQGWEIAPVMIYVAAGEYSNFEEFPLMMESWVFLIGEGASCTILRSSGFLPPRVITCEDVSGVIIEGFTIRDGFSGGYEYWGGGGIFCSSSSVIIRDNIITGNEALYCGGYGEGGGILICRGSSAVLSRNLIVENTAYGGGGICCYGASPTIVSNIIGWNEDRYLMSGGGGICCLDGASPKILNNAIVSNVGGGISCTFESSPEIINNTIAGNVADYYGSGISCGDAQRPSNPVIRDCIIWNDGDDIYNCTASFCCIQDSIEGEGNIHDDPMFVPGPPGIYYLHADSPCIDAGSRSVEDAGLSGTTTRRDGIPDTGTVDMGCHYPIP